MTLADVQKIELVNQVATPMWQLWLPFLSSVLVAVIALGGVWWQIQQNWRALEKSRKDQIDQAHRDATINDAVVAISAATEISQTISIVTTSRPLSADMVSGLTQRAAEVHASAARLRLVSTREISTLCSDLAYTCQKGVAHMLLNWHAAVAEPPEVAVDANGEVHLGEVSEASRAIFDWSAKIRNSVDQLAAMVGEHVGNSCAVSSPAE
ncbi:hypothetical protein [Gordonia sp. FQ]|uniref:hypothetical protein n=1 Tax=Gordonia sp. FQ TaxID=3446634 RepID=UPI003F863EDF